MTNNSWPHKVLLLYEGTNFGGDFDTSILYGLEAHGCEVTCLSRGKAWSPDYDLVLGYGPFTLQEGNILPVAKQLMAIPEEKRPLFAWWLTEGIPNPNHPHWFVNIASKLRLKADQWLLTEQSARSRWRDLALKGHRLRILGQLNHVRERQLLDVLAVTSASRANYLRQWGFDPIVVPLGNYAVYGGDMGLNRDIEVGFLGNTAAPRRQQLLPGLFKQLEERGIQVVVENNLYGEDRNKFLNRCRILLNVLRAPQDFVGQRFLLAAANKTLVISEPVNDSLPFVPGEHMIVTAFDDLAEKVHYYLTHEDERQALADRAHQFVSEELTAVNMVGRILEQVRQVQATKEKAKIGV